MRAQQAEQERVQKQQMKEAEKARKQAEKAQAKAQKAQPQVQQAPQQQASAPVINQDFVRMVDNITGPVNVLLSDGRAVLMREDQFRKLPLESRVQLVAENRVFRPQG